MLIYSSIYVKIWVVKIIMHVWWKNIIYSCILFFQESRTGERAADSKVLCGKCGSYNDTGFNFCKNCGCFRHYITHTLGNNECNTSEHDTLLHKIKGRIQELDSRLNSSNYCKQKCQLKNELNNFLQKISVSKNASIASPEDIRSFLIYKKENGRTQLHKHDCTFHGKFSLQKCRCPRTLAAKSVDSLIGKIRAILRDEGRAGEWNPMLFTGNPAASPLMKRHLQSITLEQQNANTVTRQAVLMMFYKLGKLCCYLTYQISKGKDPVANFLLARDLSYFSFISCKWHGIRVATW